MKMTMLTYKTLTRFIKSFDITAYDKKEINQIEHAAYVANMNQCANPEWNENDIYNDFIRVLGINKIALKLNEVKP